MRWTWLATLVLGALAACGQGEAPQPPSPPPLDLPGGKVQLTIHQRTDMFVPGSNDRLRVHLNDITRGQVELTLSGPDGATRIAASSVREGDVRRFSFEGHDYLLKVVELRNLLVGADTAILEFRAAASGRSVTEQIEGLTAAVEESGLIFLRNGQEYDSVAAADHLRRKWKAAGDRIATADAFIEHIASRSSTTGEVYRLKLADGTFVETGPWLRERLRAQDDVDPTR